MAIRVNNYHVVISTAVANFEMSRPIQDSPDMINYVATQIAEVNFGNVSIYLNGECKAHYDFFEVPNVPAVWTHTPLPVGMDALALQAKFEERAQVVLGSGDGEKVGTYKYPNTMCYTSDTLKAAWMMYVDQAIEHFVANKE